MRLKSLLNSLALSLGFTLAIAPWDESASAKPKRKPSQTRALPPLQDFDATLHSHTFKSSALARNTRYLVWTPSSKAWDGRQALPVVVLLHGLGGEGQDWFSPDLGNLEQTLSALMDAKAISPFIALAPTEPKGYWTNHVNKPKARHGDLIEEVIADCAKHHPLNGQRAIVGASMGGHGALSQAFAYPSRYLAAVSLAGALFETPPTHRPIYKQVWGHPTDTEHWKKTAPMELYKALDPKDAPPVFISWGDKDIQRFRMFSEQAITLFQAHGLDTTALPTEGGHTWDAWSQASEAWLRWLDAKWGPSLAKVPKRQ